MLKIIIKITQIIIITFLSPSLAPNNNNKTTIIIIALIEPKFFEFAEPFEHKPPSEKRRSGQLIRRYFQYKAITLIKKRAVVQGYDPLVFPHRHPIIIVIALNYFQYN